MRTVCGRRWTQQGRQRCSRAVGKWLGPLARKRVHGRESLTASRGGSRPSVQNEGMCTRRVSHLCGAHFTGLTRRERESERERERELLGDAPAASSTHLLFLQRNTLRGSLGGFVTRLRPANPSEVGVSFWHFCSFEFSRDRHCRGTRKCRHTP